MAVHEFMRALVQLGEGYSTTGKWSGPSLPDAKPYLALREVPVPEVTEGHALIRVILGAVNPSDIHFVKGEYGQPRVKGVPAGFEGVGQVVAGDTPLVGQRVAFVSGVSGSWAEYAMAPVSMLIPLRPDIRDEDAAGQIVNPLTAMAMFDIVRETKAESFVVTAAGSQLGKFLIALGHEHDIAPIAVVRRAAQADALRALGAAEVLVSTSPDFAARTVEICRSRKPRVMLDSVADQVAADIFFAMPSHARWIVYGKLAAESPVLGQMGQFIFLQKHIEGFWLSPWLAQTPPDRVASVIGEVQARFADGRWRTDVSSVINLDSAIDDLPGALSVPDGKVLIRP